MWLRVALIVLLAAGYSQRHLFERTHAVERTRGIFDEAKFFRNAQGLLVHYREMGTRPKAPRGIAIIVHGYVEHSAYYDDLAISLNQIGLATWTLDHVGHGHSEGERAYVENLDHLRDDVLYVTHLAQKRIGNNTLPMFLYGHSMGGEKSLHFESSILNSQFPLLGAIAILAAQHSPTLFKTVVLEAPFVQIHPRSGSPSMVLLGRLLGGWLPKLVIPGSALKRNLLTRDVDIVKRWEADPMNIGGDLKAGTGASFIRVADDISSWLDAKEINWSFFMAFGDKDFACDHQSGVDFYERAATPKNLKQLKIYKDAMHTLKFDPHSKQFIKDTLAWIEKFL